MGLEIEIVGRDHFAVHDGCEFETYKSNVTRSGIIPLDMFQSHDWTARKSSHGNPGGYLFYRNVTFVNEMHRRCVQYGDEVELTCPVCDARYILGERELRVGKEAYDTLVREFEQGGE